MLVVEDEPVAAEAHALYVGRVPGFRVTAVAHSRADAMRALGSAGVDLVLLDMHLPDQHGLDVVRAMRAAGHPADVIAVTSARDLGEVVDQGEVDRALAALRGSDSSSALPKGMTAATLEAIVLAVRAVPAGLSAAEAAERVGASRVTARRYLEHLADNALVVRAPRYGAPGRPEVAYRWSRT